MPNTLDINVHHVTRIEGHGNLRVRVSDGRVEQVQWQVPEAPRFFEAMVRGRHWDEVQTVTCRICGICSVSHSLAALKAIEDALGVQPSEQTDKLRLLVMNGEQLESHVLHVGYLVAPDLFGVKSVVPLVAANPDLVMVVIRLHKLGNYIMELIGGRRTHPVALRPGGFGRLPTEVELRDLKQKLQDAKPDLQALVDALLGLAGKIPAFQRPTEYVALVQPGAYPFIHGEIGSTDTSDPTPVRDYQSVVNEYVSPHSTAKWARWHRDSYAVGALARYRLNAAHLLPLAKRTARTFGLTRNCANPFMNSIAQVVETAHVYQHTLQLLDDLLTAGIRFERPHVQPKAGLGVGAVEAPRGILFHSYTFDEHGVCTDSNLVIPTNQNHANLQLDMEALVPQIADRSQEEITLLLEMLVRSYDPCVSCSTHHLDVEFI
jgi:coenzyme F420-reducing hydrogenase alpha subunit